MTAAADESRAYLAGALETVRQVFFPRAAGRIDDLAISDRFPQIVGALIVASAVEALRREVAE